MATSRQLVDDTKNTSCRLVTSLMPNQLLPSSFLKQLENHHLVSRCKSQLAGERLSRQKGGGMEFVEHKGYSAGDDLRYLDWNVYARNDQLTIKQFETSENIATYVLLDTSDSMNFGEPSKLLWGKQIAAAIGYLAMCRDDRFGIYPFADELETGMLSLRGRGQVNQVFDFIDGLQPGGKTDIGTSVQRFAAESGTGGLLFIISDFWDAEGLQRCLPYLLHNNFKIHALQILTPEEVDPGYSGELDLTDTESGERVLLTIRKGTLDQYRRELQASFRKLESILSIPATLYLRFMTGDAVENAVLRRFRHEGLLE